MNRGCIRGFGQDGRVGPGVVTPDFAGMQWIGDPSRREGQGYWGQPMPMARAPMNPITTGTLLKISLLSGNVTQFSSPVYEQLLQQRIPTTPGDGTAIGVPATSGRASPPFDCSAPIVAGSAWEIEAGGTLVCNGSSTTLQLYLFAGFVDAQQSTYGPVPNGVDGDFAAQQFVFQIATPTSASSRNWYLRCRVRAVASGTQLLFQCSGLALVSAAAAGQDLALSALTTSLIATEIIGGSAMGPFNTAKAVAWDMATGVGIANGDFVCTLGTFSVERIA